MLNVGLLFHSARSDNLGVGALTVSQVEILRHISQATGIEISVTIFDWDGARSPYVDGDKVRVVTLTGEMMKSPRAMMRLFKSCDLMIDIGAGDSFADIYGPKRLSRMIYLKYLVHMAGLPVVLAPQTFGPFNSFVSRFFARDLVRRAKVVATRDLASAALLMRLLPGQEVVTASDVALRLPSDTPNAPGSRPTVGINISGLLMSGGYQGDNDFALNMDYAEAMRGLIRRFVALPDAPQVALVPHVISPSNPQEDDMAACLTLQAEIPEVSVAPAFTTPGQAKTFIAGVDFMTGARMHACIAAFSSGVPVVPLAYSKKFDGMFGSLEYDATADCRVLDTGAVIEAVLDGYRHRDMLRHQVQVALGVGQLRLDEYTGALSRVISVVALEKKTRDQAAFGLAPRWKTLDERL